MLHDVSLELRKGEILGLAGLVGAGRTEIARASSAPIRSRGQMLIDGREVAIRSPRDAIRPASGWCPKTASRRPCSWSWRSATTFCACIDRSAARGPRAPAARRTSWSRASAKLGIRMSSPDQTVGNLSGGNQQKVVIASWLALQPKVLIMDEPTRGIDVGAKAEVTP